jgi:hypothetical protein
MTKLKPSMTNLKTEKPRIYTGAFFIFGVNELLNELLILPTDGREHKKIAENQSRKLVDFSLKCLNYFALKLFKAGWRAK